MTCYMRHMDWLMDGLGLAPEPASRTRVDRAIRDVLALPDDVHCPQVWAAIKALSEEERAALVPRVASVLSED